MIRWSLGILPSALMLGWVITASLAYTTLMLPPYLALAWGLRRLPRDFALRRFIWHYGRFLLYVVARPVLRIRVEGAENAPRGRAAVYVLNHRSATDAYFAPCYADPQTVFMVRSWPFRIPLYGWFMRAAGYVDSERQDFTSFAEGEGRVMAERGVSLIVFPEGHRSRTGRMQRFHSGGFAYAARHGLPVVPVCLQGTEVLLPVAEPRVHRATVTVSVLPAVDPGRFTGPDRVLQLRRHVQSQMREFLHEPQPGKDA
jgi:1-acyl-sn-glycerol-3-phosphate acyltransferase